MFTKKRIIIAAVILVAIIGSFFLFRGCGKKAEVQKKEEPEKEKKPAVTIVMDPADGSTVPEIGQLKFNFSVPVKTDKVKVEILGPKGKELEGSRSGFDKKMLAWVLLKRSLEVGAYKVAVESSEKEFEPVSFTLTVGEAPTPPTPTTGLSDEELEKLIQQTMDKVQEAIK